MKVLKVIAAGVVVSAHVAPAIMAVAKAQSLPPVEINGSSSGGGGGGGYWGGGGFGYSGGGGGSFPEAENFGNSSAKPPKTPAQIESAKKECDNRATQQVNALEVWYGGELARCASMVSNYHGLAFDEAMRLFGYGCNEKVAKDRDNRRFEINLAQQQCRDAAAKP